jgi:FHA domain/Zinc-ribbon containing domain
MQHGAQRATINCGGAGKGETIFSSVSPGISSDSFATGAFPGSGTFFCTACGSQLFLKQSDRLPACPRCGASEFNRDSIFEPMQDHGQTSELSAPALLAPPKWLEKTRALLPDPGHYLAFQQDSGGIQVFPIERGWTRIGRSVTADIRLDDPSVSRRHALIVFERPESLRVLDDRSLNGVFLNGELVEWGRLTDGDELAVGRFRLFALEG